MNIRTQRVYDEPEPGQGTRILVDRLWPRGLSKEKAAIDHWIKQIAPSGELRKWFAHDPSRWTEFRDRYFAELDDNHEAAKELREQLRGKKHAVLLFAARDVEHNNAVALKSWLERHRSSD